MCCKKEERPVRVTGYLSILTIGVMLDIVFPSQEYPNAKMECDLGWAKLRTHQGRRLFILSLFWHVQSNIKVP